MKGSFDAIYSVGQDEARGYNAVDVWINAQKDPSCFPEKTIHFSPEDIRQAWLRCPSAMRSGRVFDGNVPQQFPATVLRERMERAISLQRKIHWITVDGDSIELIEDFINISIAEIKGPDDDRILGRYWSSGMTLDIMMETENLKRVLNSSINADTPYEYEVRMESEEWVMSDNEPADSATGGEESRDPTSSELHGQSSRKREHVEEAIQPSTSSKKLRIETERGLDAIEKSLTFQRFPFQLPELYERFHSRAHPGLESGEAIQHLGPENFPGLHRPSWQATQEAKLALTKHSHEREELVPAAASSESIETRRSSPVPQRFFKPRYEKVNNTLDRTQSKREHATTKTTAERQILHHSRSKLKVVPVISNFPLHN